MKTLTVSFILFLSFGILRAQKLIVNLSTDDVASPVPGMLRYEINHAVDGDTIVFLVDSIGLAGEEIQLGNTELFIDGSDRGKVVIDANSASRIFMYNRPADPKNVYLKNLIIQYGSSTELGGGMYAESVNGTLKIEDCIFRNDSSLKIDYGLGSGGGGLFLLNGGEVIRCSFINNYSKAFGGGASTNYATLTDCIFSGNNSRFSGGGIYLSNSTCEGCIIDSNKTTGTAANQNGGGITLRNNSVLTNCEITNNISYDGGGFCVDDSYTTYGAILRNCRISNNTSLGNNGGGAAFIRRYSELINCIISHNQGENVGGICTYYDSTKYINCTFNKNNSKKRSENFYSSKKSGIYHDFINCIIYNSSSDSYELSSFDTNTYFNHCAIEKGIAVPGKNNIVLYGSPFVSDDDMRLNDSTVCINAGTPDTSGLKLPEYDISGTSFRLLNDSIDIGAYESNYLCQGKWEYYDTIIVTNTDTRVYIRNSFPWAMAHLNDNGLIRFANQIDSIYLSDEVQITKSMKIDGEDRMVILDGGGNNRIFKIFGFNDDTIQFKNITIQNGYSPYCGGGILADMHNGGNLIFNQCLFTNNLTVRKTDYYYHQYYYGYGGAIYATSNSYINSCTFENNRADENGGAIFISDGGTIKASSFRSNQAKLSGCGIYAKKNVRIQDSEFDRNRAQSSQGYGGGVYLNENGQIYNCVFRANEIFGKGGGAYIGEQGVISNSIFIQNEAYQGGGICVGDSIVVVNCTFTENSSRIEGGGIYTDIHSNFKNCIIYDNQADTCDNIFQLDSNNSFSYCAVNDSVLADTVTNIILVSSPFYGGSRGDSYFLAPGSNCINRGDTSAISQFLPSVDLINNSRIIDDTIDIGVYEFKDRLTPSAITWPDADSLNEGDFLFMATLRNGYSEIPGIFMYKDSLFIPEAPLYEASVTFYPDDYLNYYQVAGVVDVVVVVEDVDTSDNTISQNTITDVKLYPNPTNGIIWVKGMGAELNYRILSSAGVLISQGILNQDETEIKLSAYQKGVYYIQIYNLEQNTIKKIVVR